MFQFLIILCLSFVCTSADWSTETWDIIVVGAGPAGIIVAYRMAEAGLKTLLLEGGGLSYGVTGGDLDSRRPSWLDGTDLTRVDVPGLYKSIFADQGNLTCGATINAFGGCTIGGSSAINAGLFFEPPASDYDLYFPDGWKSLDVKNATQRVYSMVPSTSTPSEDGLQYLQSGHEAARKWLVEGLGYEDVDINAYASNKTGVFGRPIFDYDDGQRGGPVKTYLQAALANSNFTLQTGAQVLRVERSERLATGVTVLVDGIEKVFNISATGRVILSAGALQSPALLMLSGIGPASTLSTLAAVGKLSPSLPATQYVNDSSIGDGLFDNPNTFIELTGDTITSFTHSYDSPSDTDKELYLQNRSGPYSFASETSVFWNTYTHPDGNVTGFQGTIDSSGFSDFSGPNDITLNVYGTSGLKSRGKVVLDSNFVPGPDDNVYYSDPQDGKDIARFIYSIFQGLPASGLTPLNIAQNSTEAEIETYITTPSAYAKGQVNHWSSSCQLGKCVDSNAKVSGMRNLYVVDGSIVPPLTVNPQFGIMIAAERASELILKDRGCKSKSVQRAKRVENAQ